MITADFNILLIIVFTSNKFDQIKLDNIK